LLANLFLHYAFDAWMVREYPAVTFERYCDDAVVHCGSERQARQIRDAIAARMTQVGLELHPDKTRIVYCKDAHRRGRYDHEQFTFLGYTFRPRLAKSRHGDFFVSFSPAVSRDAIKRISKTIRGWRLNLRSDLSFSELLQKINTYTRGWINYYGRFYRSALYPTLRRINEYLVRWAMRKYKRLKHRRKQASALLEDIAKRHPRYLAHWQFGAVPS
jgi:RNA-directed DNA polymerase